MTHTPRVFLRLSLLASRVHAKHFFLAQPHTPSGPTQVTTGSQFLLYCLNYSPVRHSSAPTTVTAQLPELCPFNLVAFNTRENLI